MSSPSKTSKTRYSSNQSCTSKKPTEGCSSIFKVGKINNIFLIIDQIIEKSPYAEQEKIDLHDKSKEFRQFVSSLVSSETDPCIIHDKFWDAWNEYQDNVALILKEYCFVHILLLARQNIKKGAYYLQAAFDGDLSESSYNAFEQFVDPFKLFNASFKEFISNSSNFDPEFPDSAVDFKIILKQFRKLIFQIENSLRTAVPSQSNDFSLATSYFKRAYASINNCNDLQSFDLQIIDQLGSAEESLNILVPASACLPKELPVSVTKRSVAPVPEKKKKTLPKYETPQVSRAFLAMKAEEKRKYKTRKSLTPTFTSPKAAKRNDELSSKYSRSVRRKSKESQIISKQQQTEENPTEYNETPNKPKDVSENQENSKNEESMQSYSPSESYSSETQHEEEELRIESPKKVNFMIPEKTAKPEEEDVLILEKPVLSDESDQNERTVLSKPAGWFSSSDDDVQLSSHKKENNGWGDYSSD